MAQGYLRMAKVRLSAAVTAKEQEEHAFAVRLSQEAVELSLKAALRFIGIEPPHWHDVGPILREKIDIFPSSIKKNIDKIISISRSLRMERETSMYGDESTNISPDKLYTKVDSENSVLNAQFIYQLCKDLLL